MKEIRIRGLFGRFDYDIEVAGGSTTILTGPNGFGKSTILECISAISNSDLLFFSELDFKTIQIIMSGTDDHILIARDDRGLRINQWKIEPKDFSLLSRNQIRRTRISGSDTGWAVSGYEGDLLDVMSFMAQKIGEVHFIREQRMIREEEHRTNRQVEMWGKFGKRIVQTIDEIPEKLMAQMARVTESYSKAANELDSTFPQRLFNEKDKISEEEFELKLSAMQKRVEKLQKYGISNIGELGTVQFNEEDAKALKVYFEDFEKKFKPYEGLIEKLDMFTEMVNRKFLFKQIEVSEKGLRVLDENEPHKKIALSQMSSGEKETVILFYQLLFEVPDGVTLLIDEPEISLHVAWQREFAGDIRTIVESKKITTLIATHSPQFINGNRGIQIDLGELYANGLDKTQPDKRGYSNDDQA